MIPRPALFVRLALSALLVGLLAACGSAASSSTAASPAACAKADANDAIELSAANIAFSATCIDVPAGTAFTIRFANDDNVPHDVAIYTDSSKATELFKGDIIEGGTSTEYQVPALDAGTYYFECTVHPNMNGSVSAS